MEVSGRVVFLCIWVTCISGARPCPENCQVIQNPPLPTCNKVTGTCSRGCISGYFGDKCNTMCDDNCQEDKCQQRDGSCTCKPGYYFHNGTCYPHKGVKCKSNDHCLNNICISANRRDCLGRCSPGWFGKFCQQSCPPHCVCDQEFGNCTSCIPGWYGAECGSSCSPGCEDNNCHRNGTCVQCEAGQYGSTCQSECSEGCAGSNKGCKRDGSCSRGCRKGFYGEKCDSCPQQCFGDLCDEDGICSACNNGFFGTSCQKLCLRCKDGDCHQTTGECIKGCDDGFYGSICNLTCVDCKGGDCDRFTGECSGTLPYFIGGGVLFLVFVLAGLTSCCLKRMRDIVKDGVNTIGQNTAVQFVPRHGTHLRSIEKGNTETNASGTNPDDTYNHLFAIKPQEATFSLANDDIETTSGYCAVLPLFNGQSCMLLDESVDGSGRGSNGGSGCEGDGGNDTGRSRISLCNEEGNEIRQGGATAIDEKGLFPKPIQIVALRPDREEPVYEPIEIVDIRPDREKRTTESIQKGDVTPDRGKLTEEPVKIVDISFYREKRAPNPFEIVDMRPAEKPCFSMTIEDEDEATGRGEAADGCTSLGVGEQERAGDDQSATNNALDTDEIDTVTDEIDSVTDEIDSVTDEIDSVTDEIDTVTDETDSVIHETLIQLSDRGKPVISREQTSKQYVEVKVLKQF